MSTESDEISYIFAIAWAEDRVTFAGYNQITSVLYADSIPASVGEIEDILNLIKLQCNPRLFIVHPRIAENTSVLQLITSGFDGRENAYEAIIEKRASWNYNEGLQLLNSKILLRSKTGGYASGSSLRSYFDFGNKEQIQTFAVLFQHCIRENNKLRSKIEPMRVNEIKTFELSKYLNLDFNAYHSLQIFQEEIHPNILKGKGKSKEGYSLFSLFDRTKSSAGRLKLREWLSKPLRSMTIITWRQDGIEAMMRGSNFDFVNYISKMYSNISCVPTLLYRFKKVCSTTTDWEKLSKSLSNGLSVYEATVQFLRQDRVTVDKSFLVNLLGDFQPKALKKLSQEILDTIDFDMSYSSGVPSVREGFNHHLDQLRALYSNIGVILTDEAKLILNETPQVSRLTVEYLPQVGYLVVVSKEESSKLNSREHEGVSKSFFSDNTFVSPAQHYEFIFSQGDSCYFKNSRTKVLDEKFGDIRSDYLDAQKDILLKLEEAILDVELEMLQMDDILSTLDVIMCLASLAMEYQFTRPTLTQDNLIIIKDGRHPLQIIASSRASGDSFVPNDAYLDSQKNVGLITGINGSGKSVYLKQVGLLVYLAHVGSWLPCERAVIGITDRICTRISSLESASSSQSSFSLDAGQISRMLTKMTHDTLCLVDEFGKGTSPVDGISLLASVIKHFMERKRSKLLCSLHFTEILHSEILSPDSMDRCANLFHMDTIINKESNVLTPLFKLKLGSVTCSDGVSCAVKAGLSTVITDRAIHIKECLENSKCLSALNEQKDSDMDFNTQELCLLKDFLSIIDWSPDDNNLRNVLLYLKRT